MLPLTRVERILSWQLILKGGNGAQRQKKERNKENYDSSSSAFLVYFVSFVFLFSPLNIVPFVRKEDTRL